MAVIVTFVDYTPVIRYDGIPWETAQIEEAATNSDDDSDWTLIDTYTLTPVDADPENPASRNFTTNQGTDVEQWYRVRFFDANGDSSEYTEAIQNRSEDLTATPYAGTAELARILKLSNPSALQLAAMERVLEAAAMEIDSELDRAGAFGTPYPPLVVAVNLDRAVEHWRQQESPFGILGLGADAIPAYSARDSWDRHAHKLAPLKESYGLA